MSAANVLFDVLAPVALLVVLSALSGRRLDIDVGSLSRLSFYVLGPTFVFAVLADAEFEGAPTERRSGRLWSADAPMTPTRPGRCVMRRHRVGRNDVWLQTP